MEPRDYQKAIKRRSHHPTFRETHQPINLSRCENLVPKPLDLLGLRSARLAGGPEI